MRKYPAAGVAAGGVLLPRPGIDHAKWAVVACDQYTSEPDYWQRVQEIVGDAPSTRNLIYPEVYLGERDPYGRISAIRQTMQRYLDAGLLVGEDSLIYVERRIGDAVRRGLVLAVDLEHYDYHRGSSSLVRATEGTILERLPPRVRIRQGAPLELPHIMVLIDDPGDTVIGPLARRRDELPQLYDFDLMMDSGRLTGHAVRSEALEAETMAALAALAEPAAFRERYGFSEERPVLLYAMGDGNHSLATAKAIWERTKAVVPDPAVQVASPARYALVELVNVHDEALVFEPIHRVLFDVAAGRDPAVEMLGHYEGRCTVDRVSSLVELRERVDAPVAGMHRIGLIQPHGFAVIELRAPTSNLPVGSLQAFLDSFMSDGGAGSIDYVHGTSTVVKLGREPGNVGYYLPAMDKQELFKSVILDGALPRKTFSMGEAYEKRFYFEARRLF